jgi:hypothetical protein
MDKNVYLSLTARPEYGHQEIEVMISRPDRIKTYLLTEASSKRLEAIIPKWDVAINGDDGLEITAVWEKA